MKQKLKVEMTVIFDSDKYDVMFNESWEELSKTLQNITVSQFVSEEIEQAMNGIEVEIKDFHINEMEND